MKRDSIDFENMGVGKLFRRIFIPTLFGMLSICAVTTIDGIFVGHDVGSDGIAAINLCIPILMLFIGFALMLGAGASVIAAIHMSNDNVKAARINTTQAFAFTVFTATASAIGILCFPSQVARLLGSSDSLLPLVKAYLYGFIPCLPFEMICTVGVFVIRLDGAPKVAMWCNLAVALTNILLDYIFIFPLGMGVFGAAAASTLSMVLGASIVVAYIAGYSQSLRLYPLKATAKSLRLMMRNIGYQSKIGVAGLLGELTMAVLMFTGNIVFMNYFGDAGVGAFGIACYYAPFVFMVGNAIAQSAQPIISYNLTNNIERSARTQRIALATAVVCGAGVTSVFALFPTALVGLFIPNSDPAGAIAVAGLPLFATGFTFFIMNLTAIGYYQSIEKVGNAIFYALLRGIILLVPAFVVMPRLFGAKGIWLAMPVSELATFAIITGIYLLRKRKRSVTD